MKRTFSVFIIFSALVCAVFFTGCQDVIFAKIMGEVALEDATIIGRVNSIVRCKLGTQEYLFIQNGRVYRKPASSQSHGDWIEKSDGLPKLSYDYYNKKFNGIYIYQLAATENTLYALGASIRENNDGENTTTKGSRYLYYFDTGSETWLKTYDDDVTGTSGNTMIFCTNTIDVTKRTAYIRMNGSVYALSDSPSSSATCIAAAAETSALGDAPGASTLSAVYAGGVYFFNSCSATNETSSPATHVYWASGSTLKYVAAGTNASSGASAVNASLTITSIAATSDAILLGTKGRGLQKTTNTLGVPGSSLAPFSTNADSALDAPYIIPAMLCIDSAAPETGAMLYASADFKGKPGSSGGNFKDIGLWSYYPSRGNWNRE